MWAPPVAVTHGTDIALDLSDANTWAEQLGLDLVPLRRRSESGPEFVLHNGHRGSLLLALPTSNLSDTELRRAAWSADVVHAVRFDGANGIRVLRWDRNSRSTEHYDVGFIARRLQAFHAYLEQQVTASSYSVLAYVFDAFTDYARTARRDTPPSRSEPVDIVCSFISQLRHSPDVLFGRQTEPVRGTLGHDWMESPPVRSAHSGLPFDASLLFRHRYAELTMLLAKVASLPVKGFDVLVGHDREMFGHTVSSFVDSMQSVDADAGVSEVELGRFVATEGILAFLTDTQSSESSGILSIVDTDGGVGDRLFTCLRVLDDYGFAGSVRLTGWSSHPIVRTVAEHALRELTDLNSDIRMVEATPGVYADVATSGSLSSANLIFIGRLNTPRASHELTDLSVHSSSADQDRAMLSAAVRAFDSRRTLATIVAIVPVEDDPAEEIDGAAITYVLPRVPSTGRYAGIAVFHPRRCGASDEACRLEGTNTDSMSSALRTIRRFWLQRRRLASESST